MSRPPLSAADTADQDTVALPIPATAVGLFGALGAVFGTAVSVFGLQSLTSVT